MDGQTDRWTIDGRTDGQTNPHIEMHGQILKNGSSSHITNLLKIKKMFSTFYKVVLMQSIQVTRD